MLTALLFDSILPLSLPSTSSSPSAAAPAEYELPRAPDEVACMLDGSRTQGSPKPAHAEHGDLESRLVFRRRQVWQADGVRLASSRGTILCCSI